MFQQRLRLDSVVSVKPRHVAQPLGPKPRVSASVFTKIDRQFNGIHCQVGAALPPRRSTRFPSAGGCIAAVPKSSPVQFELTRLPLVNEAHMVLMRRPEFSLPRREM